MKGGGEAAEEMDISRGARIEEFLEATQVEGLYTECRNPFLCLCTHYYDLAGLLLHANRSTI